MAFHRAAGRPYCQTRSDSAYEPQSFAEARQYLKVVLLNPPDGLLHELLDVHHRAALCVRGIKSVLQGRLCRRRRQLKDLDARVLELNPQRLRKGMKARLRSTVDGRNRKWSEGKT